MFWSKCFYNVYFFVGFMSYILSSTFFYCQSPFFKTFYHFKKIYQESCFCLNAFIMYTFL